MTSLATGLIACGGDDDKESASEGDRTKAAEKAFLTGMAAHHESAIEMAEIADERTQDPFIKKLAGDILKTQERELAQMEEIYERLFDAGLRPDPGAHEELGLTAEEAGMTHSAETSEMLRRVDPFERAFVDEMVPHHRGAVRMAEAVLEMTRDARLRSLAEGIVRTQKREVAEMNDFRTKEFGGPVPEAAGDSMEPEGGMRQGEEHGAGHPG